MRVANCIFLLVGMAVLSGCYSEEDRKAAVLDDFIDKDLARVPVGLAMITAQTSLWNTACDLYKSAPVKIMPKECEVYEEARRQTAQLAKATLESKTLPQEAFLFYAWEGKDGGSLGVLRSSYGDYPVGLFGSAEDCRMAEEKLRSSDISTRPCRQWKDSEEYLEGRTEDLAILLAPRRR